MEHSLTRVAWLCAAAAFGVLLGLAMAGVSSESLAAWVQAIFSVVAILATSALWHADKRDKRREIEFQQAVFDYKTAVLRLPMISACCVEMRALENHIAREAKETPEGQLIMADPRVGCLESLCSLHEQTEGCSPALEADILAVSAWAIQYRSALRNSYEIGPTAFGVQLVGIKPEKWKDAGRLLGFLNKRLSNLFHRLDFKLNNPPNLSERSASSPTK